MEHTYIPLKDKRPLVSGWSSPDYHCTEAEALEQSDVIGLRCDGLVIVDCDTEAAAASWYRISGEGTCNHVVKTPRGFHFYYGWVDGAPDAPAVEIHPNIDLRAGRGSYVVCPPSPGYTVLEIEG